MRDELFMPGLRRQVRNGEIQIFSSIYFADELANFHMDYVEVRYDIWDASRVYAWTTRGEKICTATLNGNSIPYQTQSRMEAALEKREKAQLARLGKKADAITPGATVQLPDEQPTFTMMADCITPPEPVISEPCSAEAVLEAVQQAPARRPAFGTANERYMWLMRNPDRWNLADHSFLEDYVQSDRYSKLYNFYMSQNISWEQSAQASSE